MPTNIEYGSKSAAHYPPRWRRSSRYAHSTVTASSIWKEPEKQLYVSIKVEEHKASLTDAEDFEELAGNWLKSTAMLSSLEKKVLHKDYQRIIGIGKPALPLILSEMRRRPGHWFWALDAITKGKVNPAEHCETLTEATAAWIQWGEIQGII
jgi:hypothetical protein